MGNTKRTLVVFLSLLTIGRTVRAGESPPLKPADLAFLESLFSSSVDDARLLRTIVLTGSGSKREGGRTRSFTCDRTKEAAYCNQVAAWICHRTVVQMDRSKQEEAEALTELLHVIPPAQFAEDQIYELALSRLRTAPVAGGRRPADVWAPRVEDLRVALRNRDLTTEPLRAALAQVGAGARGLNARAVELDLLMEHGLAPKSELPQVNGALENVKRSLRALLAEAYGPLPDFEMGVTDDAKIYVSFALTTATGNTGHVVAELTPRGLAPYRGPTLVPVALRPDFPLTLEPKDLSSSAACFMGARYGQLAPIPLQPKWVEMPGQDPFVAFDTDSRTFRPGALLPPHRQQPTTQAEVARTNGDRHHPAEIRPAPLAEWHEVAEAPRTKPGTH